MASKWTVAQVEKLRTMYLDNEPNSSIALKLRKTVEQVDARIFVESRAGRLQRDGKKQRWAKRKKAHGNFKFQDERAALPTTTYEENGVTITVCPPMYAWGIAPGGRI